VEPIRSGAIRGGRFYHIGAEAAVKPRLTVAWQPHRRVLVVGRRPILKLQLRKFGREESNISSDSF
jgi:hypothetical protein